MKNTVTNVMTTRVIWVRQQASFKEMAAALREHRVSAFPVIDDDDKVIGVVSEADMLAKEAWTASPRCSTASCTTGTRRRRAGRPPVT